MQIDVNSIAASCKAVRTEVEAKKEQKIAKERDTDRKRMKQKGGETKITTYLNWSRGRGDRCGASMMSIIKR